MAANYLGLTGVVSGNTPHLGGNIKGGDPYTFCPRVWDYVISRFSIGSVLDLGSGDGGTSQYFFKKGLKTVAVEGLAENIATSLYPTIQIDLTKEHVNTRVDLVHCQEVVEHIEERYLNNLLKSLTCGRIVLMTHALPGQTGHHHVNCQPPEYWINHMNSLNYIGLEADTFRIRELAKQDGAIYMASTGLLFANRS